MVPYLRAGEVLDDEHHPLALQEFLSYVSYFLRHNFLEIRCFSVRRIFANSSVRFLRSDLLCSFALPTCYLSAPRFIAEPLPHDFIPDFCQKYGLSHVTEQIATRPRWFQFAFAASLLTFRANGPQIAPLFELPPAGRDDSRFPLYAVARNLYL